MYNTYILCYMYITYIYCYIIPETFYNVIIAEYMPLILQPTVFHPRICNCRYTLILPGIN